MKRTGLIFSSALVSNDLIDVFGPIVPVQLPFKGLHLLEIQRRSLEPFVDNVIVLLPHGYTGAIDSYIKSVNLDVKYVPIGISLIDLFRFVTGIFESQELLVIYGDTYINGDLAALLEKDGNVISVSSGNDDAKYFGHKSFPKDTVFSGVLSLKCARLFRAATEIYKELNQVFDYMIGAGDLSFVHIEGWFDFGSVEALHKSKKSFAVSRSFNNISNEGEVIYKTCPSERLEKETFWYENFPIELCYILPRYCGKNKNGYWLEYVNNITLAELLCFGKVGERKWIEIIANLLGVIYKFKSFPKNRANIDCKPESLSKWVRDKTKTRFNTFLNEAKFIKDAKINFAGQDVNLLEALDSCLKKIKALDFSLMHGDLCFSNITYDPIFGKFKFIDPRGGFDVPSVFGSYIYDLAKLNHSIIGEYDFIMADQKEVLIEGGIWNLVESRSVDQIIKDFWIDSVGELVDLDLLNALTASLFFSMLPLHSDSPEKQKAMLLTALKFEMKL